MDNKNIVVIGGGSGVGLKLSQMLRKKGFKISENKLFEGLEFDMESLNKKNNNLFSEGVIFNETFVKSTKIKNKMVNQKLKQNRKKY